MDAAYIQELMKMMETHHIDLVRLKEGEQEILLERKGPAAQAYIPTPVAAATIQHPPSTPVPVTEPIVTGTYVTSPMVGTFYSAASPDMPPFVGLGTKIEPQTVVCIIEAMKVMNEVKSGVSGVIAEVLVKNGDPIEFGTKLFRVT